MEIKSNKINGANAEISAVISMDEVNANVEKIAKQRSDARKMLLDGITPILETYTKENGISIVFDKKNLVMGDSDLDITKLVIEKLNIDLPSIKLN